MERPLCSWPGGAVVVTLDIAAVLPCINDVGIDGSCAVKPVSPAAYGQPVGDADTAGERELLGAGSGADVRQVPAT